MHQYLILVFFVLTILFDAKLLNGNGPPATDSLIHILNNSQFRDEKEKCVLLCNIAESSVDADSILHYSKIALLLSKKLEIDSTRPLSLIGLGYLRNGNIVLALEKFTQVANQYKQEKNDIGLATIYDYISNAYSTQQDYSNSILYLKKAIKIFRSEDDLARLAMAQHNLGYEYFNINQNDSALNLFFQSKLVYKSIGHEVGYAYCIGNEGLVYSRLKQYDKAESHLLEAINILKSFSDDYAVSDFMIEYANVLGHKGNIKKAIEYGQLSFENATQNNISELKRDAAKCLANLFGGINKFDSAYYYQSLFIAYSDSIKNLETIQKMADLRTEYEVSQKQKEVDILEKNKTIQQIVIGALIVVILLGGGLVYTYYTSLKRSRKFSRVLEERRKLLEQQSAELKQLNRIKDRFFSIISHDLRGPISSLGGISTLINESIVSNNQALLHEITDYIDQTVLSLTGLLENLLNWALSQQGQLMLKIEKVNLKELIDEVAEVFSTVFISKGISLKLNLQDDLFITGDQNSLMTVFRNLLSNALKFTEKGGKISIYSIKKEDIVEIAVTDNGIGIPKEKLVNLFDLKEDKSTRGTEKEKGIGLGLTLVNEFVEMNKGTIEVTSEPGKGSTFTILFQVAE